MSVKNADKKERMTLNLENGFKDFVEILSKKFNKSNLQICNVLFLNGIDTFLLTASTDLKNVNFDSLEKWVDRFQLHVEVEKVVNLNKATREGEK